jgi:hypothetical protein
MQTWVNVYMGFLALKASRFLKAKNGIDPFKTHWIKAE